MIDTITAGGKMDAPVIQRVRTTEEGDLVFKQQQTRIKVDFDRFCTQCESKPVCLIVSEAGSGVSDMLNRSHVPWSVRSQKTCGGNPAHRLLEWWATDQIVFLKSPGMVTLADSSIDDWEHAIPLWEQLLKMFV